ncbi:MAG: hypothetical protein ACLQRH_14750 [Acidimicrobiales bacterium]|jgi:hypothetical protein
MAAQPWCRLKILGADGAELAVHVLHGPGQPDLNTVDDVARLALLAKRLGGGIVFTQVSPALLGLLDLCGLGLEVAGQSEGGEEAMGIQEVQEESHPDDPSL